MESKDTDGEPVKSQPPGFGMKMVISGIVKKFPSVKNIHTDQLYRWIKAQNVQQADSQPDLKSDEKSGLKGKLIVLDARPEEEYKIGHLPGSVRVDYESKAEDILAAAPQLSESGANDTVVCYCSVGYRSSMVAQTLDRYFQKQESASTSQPALYNLEGSIFKWANEGKPMVDINQQPTKSTHPYNTMFGLLLNKDLRKSTL